jgi:hypothetical protein
MRTTQVLLKEAITEWANEDAKFVSGNASAGTRARKALAEVMKLAKQRRGEIQDQKNADKAEK